ncbi:MAG: response regulator [Phenylobacterium sp.]|uniref:response regulator n=1 Tax=Phenylobacterium sp. TaxID=1871053 RepID=UPI0012294B2D|nr:response regulator [Phenylobacterium sp.]TAJ68783.1 MAG: response regulator [Phenylobacterium sp.]
MGEVSHLRVLVVHDEVLVADLVRDALEDAGFTVTLAATGAEALTELAEGEGAIVGLVTDINLGSGPSGWVVATAARERDAAVAIVYVTGDSAHEWSAHGVPNSIVVTKPFAPSQIVVALSSLLNRAGSDG